MSVTLMTTSTPRAADEENHFPAHYSEADQMARFSSTGGCRHNNGSDKVTLLARYIMILHNFAMFNVGQGCIILGQCQGCHHLLGLHVLIPRGCIFCWHRLVGVSPIFCSEEVGECLARHHPSRLSTRIPGNPVVRGIRVLATNSFEGEEINKETIP